MNDYKALMKFLEDNHNDIKNFDFQLSGKEVVDLIGLFAFTSEVARFFAEQEAVKGTDKAEAKMLEYEESAGYFVGLVAVTVRGLMISKPKPEEKH